MYKVLHFLVLAVVFLTGCQVNNSPSNTPQEALAQIHIQEGFAGVIEIYDTIDIDEDRVISIYKEILNKLEEIFVANIEQRKNGWIVTDAIGIGMPSPQILGQSSATESFQAGYLNETSPAKENVIIIEMDDSDYNIWIEVEVS